ncbi:MAG TPA: hypothetical protein VG942_08815 [Hyphomonadaceae bacterium]|nr:hypothetical protein [Hyphomonadaceae bacterium]
MKTRICYVAAAAALLGACASVEPHPSKRPLTQAEISQLSDTNFALVENNEGIATSWLMADSSASGAQYGLIGALVSASMDAMMNAGPGGRAQQAADDLATVALTDKLNKSLQSQFDAMKISQQPGGGVRIAEVSTVQKILSPSTVNDAVEVTISYTLSEDATAINVVATATYNNSGMKYATPYKFKSVPKDELSGPIYRNSFVYESNRFSLPTLTPEVKQQLVDAIQKKWVAKTGSLPVSANAGPRKSRFSTPVKESKDFEDMTKEIKAANDNTLSKEEASALLTGEWLKSGGAPLLHELEAADAFIAKYIIADLNNPAVPSLEGSDQVVEQLEGGRTVRLVGAGFGAGSYVSSPGGLKAVTTFGNAVQIADVHRKRIQELQDTAKKQGVKAK